MLTDLQNLIPDFTDFKKYVLQELVSSNKANRCDTKHLYNVINDLQDEIKSKDQNINLLRSDIKTLQDQLIVNESNRWISLSSISNRNYKRKAENSNSENSKLKARAENSNCGFKTFNKFTPLSADISKPADLPKPDKDNSRTK